MVGTAGLTGIGTGSGAGDLTVGRLAAIVTNSDQGKDGKGPKGAPEASTSPTATPEASAGAKGGPEGKGPKEKGSDDHAWKYGPDGCDRNGHDGKDRPDMDGKDRPGKDAKGAPLGADTAKGKASRRYHDDWDPRCGSAPDGDPEVIEVPCDPDELVAALVRANAAGGGTLQLAADCTYTLTAYDEHEGQHENHAGRRPWGDDYAGAGGMGGNGTSGEVTERSGLPLIRQPIRIKGEGATITRPVSAEPFRFFTVRDGGQLKLSDVTLENGREANGGSIKVEFGGTAVIERTEITQSIADSSYGGGGAIFNDGRLTVIESKLTDNSAAGVAGRGGGILNGGLLTVEQSELTDNSANGYGGGIANHRASADVSRSNLAHNTASEGGAIASYSSRTKVWDSKVSHNTARSGGGIAIREGTLAVRHVKISDNIGLSNGGGIATAEGLVVIDDSLIKANTTFGGGGGVAARKASLIVRGTEIVRNDAVGPESVGGGIALDVGKLTLSRSTVTENEATNEPGGVFANNAQVTVDEETVISKNRPTNCEGSPTEIPNCFG